ncbi:hypothetical protein [Thalassobacillus pellis]|uniref:hypothetical protein n=1 Tax=Thalassobacillus pellis TaxID=748008 RepID=UPI00195FB6D7|nr:hypothetical protein [Thalassobacillus pellis]MBM7554364.1 hypothetical protein [Thalassobacillus pellis]
MRRYSIISGRGEESAEGAEESADGAKKGADPGKSLSRFTGIAPFVMNEGSATIA